MKQLSSYISVYGLSLCALCGAAGAGAQFAPPTQSTRVGRSDIAINQPNMLPTQAIGLGNGRLGIAVWSANGLSIQLNRIDTLPERRSPGQVSFPDLQGMTADRGFRGRVNLYDGLLTETGGGITLTAWVDTATDRVVIDLENLPTRIRQRVILQLWEPRSPFATAAEGIGMLAETWRDDQLPGAS